MNKTFLSIIVPVYKVEKYLPKCIDSILGQSYRDFELILVDDGSPDGSAQICDEYASRDTRIRVVHKKNEGVGIARNTGIDKALGQWILFIDSDDYIDQGYLIRGVNEINNNGNIEAVIFPNNKDNEETGERVLIDDIFENDKLIDSKQMFHSTELFEWSSCIYSKFYNKQLLNTHSVRFANTPVFEDVLFNMTYFMYTKQILYINTCYYHYMIYPSIPSLTRSIKKPKDIMVTTQTFLALFDELKMCNVLSDYDKNLMQERFFRVASWYIRGLYQLENDYSNRKSTSLQYLPILNRFKIKVFTKLWLRKVFLTTPILPFVIKDKLLLKMCNKDRK